MELKNIDLDVIMDCGLTPAEMMRIYDQTGKLFLYSTPPFPTDDEYKNLWNTEDIDCEIVDPKALPPTK